MVNSERSDLPATPQAWSPYVPPDLPIIALPLEDRFTSPRSLNIHQFLLKPITRQELLEAIEDTSQKEQASRSEHAPRWFRVRVTDMRTGKTKVNVNIPISLVNVGMRMGARFAPEVEGLNLDQVMQAVKQGAQGKVIDVEDEEDGERVEIYVE